MAIHGEIHIFSNLVRGADCLMDTTSLVSSHVLELAKKSRKPTQRAPMLMLFLFQPGQVLMV